MSGDQAGVATRMEGKTRAVEGTVEHGGGEASEPAKKKRGRATKTGTLEAMSKNKDENVGFAWE